MVAETILRHVVVVQRSTDGRPVNVREEGHGDRVDKGLGQASVCRPVEDKLIVEGRLHHDHGLVLWHAASTETRNRPQAGTIMTNNRRENIHEPPRLKSD